ncbi:hypothetical protein [Acaryochloris sp. CCMEE 5410]|uniref:hypothetical protein n=1 Tax=Acaryochloris sp. CCMEE 5410 TaxID=310037 RepID=UPI0002E04C70|nr:hypothetical protein [Acaryochloris sp. CCMEE 5410]KAI9133033.1 hypothetical protein ON05_006615 [Acaryochloris sp. CCMEE 5410]
MMADPDPGDMLPEYDFTQLKGVVRSKYASKAKHHPQIVWIADDLKDTFPDDEAVNAALRDYLKGHTVEAQSG